MQIMYYLSYQIPWCLLAHSVRRDNVLSAVLEMSCGSFSWDLPFLSMGKNLFPEKAPFRNNLTFKQYPIFTLVLRHFCAWLQILSARQGERVHHWHFNWTLSSITLIRSNSFKFFRLFAHEPEASCACFAFFDQIFTSGLLADQ